MSDVKKLLLENNATQVSSSKWPLKMAQSDSRISKYAGFVALYAFKSLICYNLLEAKAR